MPDGTSLVNVGELAKPATTLIEKISSAIGIWYEPHHKVRMAKADVMVEQIRELGKIETSDLIQRTAKRFLAEETKKQENIEAIIEETIPQLNDGAKPENIENDWMTNFFDKSKLTSDEEMRKLWSSILVGEANNPGKFSKRTVNFVADLDKKDAELFTKLCGYSFQIGSSQPLIFDPQADIYAKNGINFAALKHLDAIGLISFESVAGYNRLGLQKSAIIFYQKMPLKIAFPNDIDNQLGVGKVLLTSVGEELAMICNPDFVDGFIDYTTEEWKKQNIILEKLIIS